MRVGTSLLSSDVVRISKDHPHACGDKVPAFAHDFKTAGSSPCVWGQVPISVAVEYHDGIIPMRVGTRHKSLKFSDDIKDHPHACGDKITLDTGATTKFRIIPMRVGTSWALSA